MIPLDAQLAELQKIFPLASKTPSRTGAHLIAVPDYPMPPGWNHEKVTVYFVAPPGYPAAQPDCFWLEPTGIRLKNGATPQNSNDANQVPEFGPRGTWFSWHVQQWNPNQDSLTTYLHVIRRRLDPAR